VTGHRAVAAALKAGVSEFELHMQYCLASQQCDDDLPYASIVGLNEHAAILHYQHRVTEAPPVTRSLLIDAGAQVNGYAADVTRTYALSNDRFAELIEATTDLQQRVCALVSAGMDFVTLNDRCHELLARVLVEFDFVRCAPETAHELGVTTTFLPHGLGHLLGLQVHDVGGQRVDRSGALRPPPARHPFLRLTRSLEPDMVITIEPGIYFISSLLEKLLDEKPGILRLDTVEAFLPYGGIRIEDNVRVKSGGHENLTLGAFSD
jgi:Xaa-Pro dipeptidase